MKNNLSRAQLLLALLAFTANLSPAHCAAEAGPVLTLENFIAQVKHGHTGLQGALESSDGAAKRSIESELLTTPAVFGTTQYTTDARPNPSSLFTYDKLNTTSATLGVSQLTSFGLQARLSYSLIHANTVNPGLLLPLPVPAGALSAAVPTYVAAPTLELTQSLWGNGFGRTTRATMELQRSQALAASHGARFQARATLLEAELAYWRLALLRQFVAVQEDAFERARKIHEWSARRARLHLADAADELQARAALESRRLDLQSSLDDNRDASRAFNSLRGIDSHVVPERVADLGNKFADTLIEKQGTPTRAPLRDDVKAAEEARNATIAGAAIASERDKPSLDLFGSYSRVGYDTSFGGALGSPFSNGKGATTVGLRFSMPLDAGALGTARAGWAAETAAAEKTFTRKVFEQEQGWQSLNEKLIEAKKRLQLSRAVEGVQLAKLENEKKRLQQGRTVTYQVLLFEQEYALAQLQRIRLQAEVLTTLAQLKLFGEAL